MSGPEKIEGVAPSTGQTAAAAGQSAPRTRSRYQTYLSSGSKKHVIVGLLIISTVTCVPYFIATSGTQHQNHADYMDAAEKARQSRLSSSASSS